MSKFLKRQVGTVFVMLGNSCNLNCRYCLQHPLVERQLAGKINPEIYEFLEELAADLPEGRELHIQFYGGEPLLYFANIREIVGKTKNFCWHSVITNGKAITKEMAEFMDANNMPITVSWDGRNVKETRGFDVFAEDAPQREILLGMKRLCLSAVLCSGAYPSDILEDFQKISDAYYDVHGYQVGVNVDEIFDTGGVPGDLLDVDYGRVEREMFTLTREYIAHKTQREPVETKEYAKTALMDGMFGCLKEFYGEGGGWKRNYCACGNGYNVLNMDLSGKLYACHNTSVPVGDIHDGYFKYLNAILGSDGTMKRRQTCEQCLAAAYCRGGCKLVSDEARAAGYCRLKQAVFLPVLSVFQEYGAALGGDTDGC